MDEAKFAALVAEGLSEGEARYLVSEGTDTTGLNPPEHDDTSESTVSALPSEGRERQSQDAVARESELRDLRERNARLDERMRLFREAIEQPEQQVQPKQKPDCESNPFEYMAWLEEQVDGLRQNSERTMAQQQENAAYVELTNTFRNDAAAYARSNPDFWESSRGAGDGAYHFLMRSRDAELQAAGYLDPAERARIIMLDERDIVARAFHAKQQNPNAPGPAQVLYNLAVSRGYQQRSGGRAAQRGGPAAQQGGFDLERISQLGDRAYQIWKSSLSPDQRKQFDRALGAA
jgi:hypothetical protein